MSEKYSNEKFIAEIKKEIEGISGIYGNTDWTTEIKKCLVDVSDKHGLYSNCTLHSESKGNDPHEWLFDFISYSVIEPNIADENIVGKIIDEVYLCAESEWATSFHAILYDFQKLLFQRTKIRLMIYSIRAKKRDEFRKILTDIIKQSKACQTGDIFLFGEYDLDEDTNIKVWTFPEEYNK